MVDLFVSLLIATLATERGAFWTPIQWKIARNSASICPRDATRSVSSPFPNNADVPVLTLLSSSHRVKSSDLIWRSRCRIPISLNYKSSSLWRLLLYATVSTVSTERARVTSTGEMAPTPVDGNKWDIFTKCYLLYRVARLVMEKILWTLK